MGGTPAGLARSKECRVRAEPERRLVLELDDNGLMRRIQSGDEHAFGQFVERYQKRFYRTAYASLRNREEALDATQEAFMKIFRARLLWRPDANPGTWAYRILLNHCIDRSRRRRLRDGPSLDAAREA